LFLEREIKSRKQTFGVEIYDLMEELEASENISTSDKEAKIRASFDQARKDIAVIQAKKECKKEEMSVLDPDGTATNDIPPSSGTVLTNSHPQDSEVRILFPPWLFFSFSQWLTCFLPPGLFSDGEHVIYYQGLSIIVRVYVLFKFVAFVV
jgi:hypothetical protein